MTDRGIDRWYVLGSSVPMPGAERVVYADGSAGPAYTPGTDLELSHWVPTTTPERWAADSSTETCLRFVADPPPEHYDLAVNNHLDVDGILALFSLVEPELALSHRATVVGAAEMGDFAAGVDRDAFRLAQELTLLIADAQAHATDLDDTYRSAFELVVAVLTGAHDEPVAVTRGWQHLEAGARRIADGTVHVESMTERLVSYALPRLDGDALDAALRVPRHNSLVDESVWLWPHTRNRTHGQCVQLVSVPTADGCFHDVWYPGYMWANTPQRWRAPGLRSTGDSNVWVFDHAPLSEALDSLQRAERNRGSWVAASTVTPFESVPGRNFPVVASFVDEHGRPASSSLDPGIVAGELAPAFGEATEPTDAATPVASRP